MRHELSRLAPRLGLNATELLAWRRLRARLGDALDEHAAECIGVVQTEAGPALRARLVTDADGRLAPSLAMLFDDPLPAFSAASLIQALDEFESWLLAHRIPLSDLNAGNFAVVERDGRVRLVCVDLKSTVSSRELVPLSRWSWALMQRKIIRRCQRLRQRIGACPGEAALTDLTGLS